MLLAGSVFRNSLFRNSLIANCCMLSTLNTSSNCLEFDPLETCVRTALELGELSPGLETQIKHWASRRQLSERDRKLLMILQDAVEDGCICRVSS